MKLTLNDFGQNGHKVLSVMFNLDYSFFVSLYTKQPKTMAITTPLMDLRAHWLMLLTLERALEEMFTLTMMNFGQQIPVVLFQHVKLNTKDYTSGTI